MCFSYFGHKAGLLKYYQRPAYNYIIEPFCGSARYACKYGLTRKVWINDKYPVIYGIWKWIQKCTTEDINRLPNLKRKGETLNDYPNLCQEERDLLGFATGVGRAQPVSKMAKFGAGDNKGTIALKDNLRKYCDGKIAHWKITNIDWSEIPNIEATWYIDPPYQHYGKHYKHNEKKINFKELSEWCLGRRGQIIVCEAAPADWLKFVPLRSNLKRLQRDDEYQEVVFHRTEKGIPGRFNLS